MVDEFGVEIEPPLQREIFDFIEPLYDRKAEILAMTGGERMDCVREFAAAMNVGIAGIKALDSKGNVIERGPSRRANAPKPVRRIRLRPGFERSKLNSSAS